MNKFVNFNKIKDLAGAIGLTIDDLYRALEISRASWYNYSGGHQRISMDMVVEISKILDCPIWDILTIPKEYEKIGEFKRIDRDLVEDSFGQKYVHENIYAGDDAELTSKLFFSENRIKELEKKKLDLELQIKDLKEANKGYVRNESILHDELERYKQKCEDCGKDKDKSKQRSA